jgi:hypothetical protein
VADDDAVKKFHGGDRACFDWVEQHGGYVLTKYTRGQGYSLHIPPCKHLGPYQTDVPRATKKPRWWAAARAPLERLAGEMSNEDSVHECGLCMHRASPTTRRRW